MTAKPDRPNVEFRAVNYADAHTDLSDLKPSPYPELEPRNRGIFVVAYLHRRLGAWGGYRTLSGDPTGGTAEIVRMYVRSCTGGAGLGRALLAELEERAWDDDYRRIVVQGERQLAAKALYEVFGYRLTPGLSPDPGPDGRQSYVKELAGE